MKYGVWKFHVDYIEPYGGLIYTHQALVVLVPGGLCHYCPVIVLGGSSFYGAAVDRVQVKLCGKILGLFRKGGGLVSVLASVKNISDNRTFVDVNGKK